MRRSVKVVLISLGLFGAFAVFYFVYQCHQQNAAIDHFHKFGAKIYSRVRMPPLLAQFMSAPPIAPLMTVSGVKGAVDNCFRRPVEMELRGKVADDDLRYLSGLDDLEMVRLIDCDVTDDGLQHMARLKNLTHLRLIGSQIRGEGLRYLTGLKNLNSIHIERGKLSTGLVHLKMIGSLRSLDLEGTRVGDDEVRNLLEMKELFCLELPADVSKGMIRSFCELETLQFLRWGRLTLVARATTGRVTFLENLDKQPDMSK